MMQNASRDRSETHAFCKECRRWKMDSECFDRYDRHERKQRCLECEYPSCACCRTERRRAEGPVLTKQKTLDEKTKKYIWHCPNCRQCEECGVWKNARPEGGEFDRNGCGDIHLRCRQCAYPTCAFCKTPAPRIVQRNHKLADGRWFCQATPVCKEARSAAVPRKRK